MGGFFYFAAEGTRHAGPGAEELRRLGLAHLIGEPLAWRGCAAGPAGLAGTVLAAGAEAQAIGYYPDEQEWREITPALGRDEQAGRCWVGRRRGEAPGPEDLARRVRRAGYEVRLGDGRVWTIPPVRFLPSKYGLSETGEFLADPLPEYAPLTRQAEALRAEVLETVHAALERRAEPPTRLIQGRQVYELCAAFLAINYRVGIVEVSALGLLNDQTLPALMAAILDLPILDELRAELAEKKSAVCAAGGPG